MKILENAELMLRVLKLVKDQDELFKLLDDSLLSAFNHYGFIEITEMQDGSVASCKLTQKGFRTIKELKQTVNLK